MAARAESDDPASEPARMLHARVLAAMRRDADAAREFTVCAADPGVSAEECTRAKHLATNVELARSEPAPAFELKTADGKPVSLDSLAGKVVLIDFWATWCSACRSDAGYIQSTAEMFDKSKFVLLEVSADDSRNTWENYVREHRMQGVNVWDDQHTVADRFHVAGYPTYVVLDGDGVMRMRALGTEGDLKGTVRKLLEEQKTAEQRQAGLGAAMGIPAGGR
jgi:thiol-disulfide isomerase/thioredoxin